MLASEWQAKHPKAKYKTATCVSNTSTHMCDDYYWGSTTVFEMRHPYLQKKRTCRMGPCT